MLTVVLIIWPYVLQRDEEDEKKKCNIWSHFSHHFVDADLLPEKCTVQPKPSVHDLLFVILCRNNKLPSKSGQYINNWS